MFNRYLLLLIFLFTGIADGQDFISFRVSGNVTGYYFEPSGFLKKAKIEMEGSLKNVFIEVLEDGDVIFSDHTDATGNFTFDLPSNATYTFVFHKEGYRTEHLIVQLPIKANVSGTIVYKGVEILLNSYLGESDKPGNIGRLSFNQNRETFEFFPNPGRKDKKGNFDNAVELMSRAIIKYPLSFEEAPRMSEDSSAITINVQPENRRRVFRPVDEASPLDTLSDTTRAPEGITIRTDFELVQGLEDITGEELDRLERRLRSAREQLELDRASAKTHDDSVIVRLREQQLDAAEREIHQAREIIALQEDTIRAHKVQQYVMIGGLLVLGVFAMILLLFLKERRKRNRILQKRKKEVDESLAYARRIQSGFITSATPLQSTVEEFFLIDMPRDVVSGDFFWWTETEQSVIMAAIDCTGHGVPGAFLTSMANTYLNRIVNEEEESDPGTILEKLHSMIYKGLHQDEDDSMSEAGMDMSICRWDKNGKHLAYAGAFNPLIAVTANTTKLERTDLKSVGGRSLRGKKDDKRSFKTREIWAAEPMDIYLFSDGYMDQFGMMAGETQPVKFGLQRFKEMVLGLYGDPGKEKQETIRATIESWKGPHRQTDDILVIGFSIRP